LCKKEQGSFNALKSLQSDFKRSYCSHPFGTEQKELAERADI